MLVFHEMNEFIAYQISVKYVDVLIKYIHIYASIYTYLVFT